MTIPGTVARFERLIYASLVLGMIAVLADLGRLARLGPILAILASNVLALCALVPLSWLIARQRAGWARWVLLAIYLAGLPLLLGGLFISEVGDVKVARANLFVIALVVMQVGAQGAALAHVFGADARAWFSGAGRRTPAAQPGSAAKPRLRIKAGRRVVVAPGSLDHRARVAAFIAEMRTFDVAGYTAAPPNFRLLWALGFKLPPPFFLGPLPLLLIVGVPFGALWGAGMWLATWLVERSLPLWAVMAMATLAGLSVGAAMAAYYRLRASELPLPAWENYLPPR